MESFQIESKMEFGEYKKIMLKVFKKNWSVKGLKWMGVILYVIFFLGLFAEGETSIKDFVVLIIPLFLTRRKIGCTHKMR